MSRTFKTTAVRVLAAAALVELLAAGTASAVTLAHHARPAAATPVSDAEDAAPARPAMNTGSTTVGDPARNCTRGHLSHGHC